MTKNLRAIYERGVLRLKEPLPLPDGTAVDVIVTSREATDTESQIQKDRPWDMLIQLLAECAIDTGIPNLAQHHDHYLYGISEKL